MTIRVPASRLAWIVVIGPPLAGEVLEPASEVIERVASGGVRVIHG